MRTNLKFWLILLLMFNAFAYGIWYLDIIQFNLETKRQVVIAGTDWVQVAIQMPLQPMLLATASVFLVVLAVVFYILERLRDKQEIKDIEESKRKRQRRHYASKKQRKNELDKNFGSFQKRGVKAPFTI